MVEKEPRADINRDVVAFGEPGWTLFEEQAALELLEQANGVCCSSPVITFLSERVMERADILAPSLTRPELALAS